MSESILPSSLSIPKQISSNSVSINQKDGADFKLSKSFLLKEVRSKSNKSKGKGKGKAKTSSSLFKSRKVSGFLIPERSVEVVDSQTQQPLSSHSLASSSSSSSSPSFSPPIIVTRTIQSGADADAQNNPNDSFNIRTTYLLMGNELWAWNVKVDRQGVEVLQTEQQESQKKNDWKWTKEVLKLPQPCLNLEILPNSELMLFTRSNERIFVSHQFLPSSNPKVSNIFKISTSSNTTTPSSKVSDYDYIHSNFISPSNSSTSKKLIEQAKESGKLRINGLDYRTTSNENDQEEEDDEEIFSISNPDFTVSSIEVKIISKSKSNEQETIPSGEKKSNRKRGRNSAIEVIDEADAAALKGSSDNKSSTSEKVQNVLSPVGSLTLQIGVILVEKDEKSKIGSNQKVERYIKISEIDLSTSGIEIGKAENLKHVQIGGDNTLGWIDSSGTYSFTNFSLSSSEENIKFSETKSFHLKSSNQTCIQSFEFLSSSHLFLSSIDIQTEILQVFLLDLELVSILATKEILLDLSKTKNHSSNQNQNRNGIKVELLRKGGKKLEVLVGMKSTESSSTTTTSNNKNEKSNENQILNCKIFEIDYSIPNESVLIQAIHSNELNRTYLSSGPNLSFKNQNLKSVTNSNSNPSKSQPKDFNSNDDVNLKRLSKSQKELILDLRKLSLNNDQKEEEKIEKLEERFFKWLDIEEERVEREWREKLNEKKEVEVDEKEEEKDAEGDNENEMDLDQPDQQKKKPNVKGKGKKTSKEARLLNSKDVPRVKFEREFVKQLIVLVLPLSTPSSSISNQSSKSKSQPSISRHSHKIVRKLLGSGLLSNELYSSAIKDSSSSSSSSLNSNPNKSIILKLKDLKDWSNITIGLRAIKDLSEEELILCLINRIGYEKKRSFDEPSSENDMSLKVYLSKVISLPISPPLLRKSLKNHLVEIDDVIMILENLLEWLEVEVDENQLFSNSTKIDDVITFTTHLLDVFFPILLSTPKSHHLIQSISTALNNINSTFNMLSTLISPLKPFEQVQSDYHLLDSTSKKNNDLREISIKRPSMKILNGGGISNVLEFGLKTPKVDGSGNGNGRNRDGKEKTDRLKKFEDNARVGPYSIEVLEI